MTQFGPSTEAKLRGKHLKSGTETTVPWPGIEPKTFSCRWNSLHVMPWTQVRLNQNCRQKF